MDRTDFVRGYKEAYHRATQERKSRENNPCEYPFGINISPVLKDGDSREEPQ